MNRPVQAIDEKERTDRLRLFRSPSVGPITWRQLMARFGNAEAALEGAVGLARRAGRNLKLAEPAAIARERKAAAAMGVTFVTLGEPAYPAPLAATEDAPPVLAVLGAVERLSAPSLAIVGSRNASVAGRSMANRLATGLGAAGYTIVSGLARGIDTAAHRGALQSGTVAALAGGLDRLYPPENADLAAAIVDNGGALVSEMPLGAEPRARDFPRRNRIISGLSLATIVVEAARRSGSLITSRLAAEQGRMVFAVPGSPVDPRAEGANMLIRGGATLVTSAEDVLEDVAPNTVSEPLPELYDEPPPAVPDEEPLTGDGQLDTARATVMEALGPSPVEIDAIVRHTGLDAPNLQLVLLELDLAGMIQRHPGQRVSLIG